MWAKSVVLSILALACSFPVMAEDGNDLAQRYCGDEADHYWVDDSTYKDFNKISKEDYNTNYGDGRTKSEYTGVYVKIDNYGGIPPRGQRFTYYFLLSKEELDLSCGTGDSLDCSCKNLYPDMQIKDNLMECVKVARRGGTPLGEFIPDPSYTETKSTVHIVHGCIVGGVDGCGMNGGPLYHCIGRAPNYD